MRKSSFWKNGIGTTERTAGEQVYSNLSRAISPKVNLKACLFVELAY